MAKNPMTKGQIVSHFAEKFELSKKTAAEIMDEVAALAVWKERLIFSKCQEILATLQKTIQDQGSKATR